MRSMIVALLLLPVPAFGNVVAAPAATCERDYAVVEAGSPNGDPKGFQRLDQLPPAAEYLAVYRRVGACPAPIIVRYNIGRPAAIRPH